MKVLAVNSGGASLRIELHEIHDAPTLDARDAAWQYYKEGTSIDTATAFDDYHRPEPDIVAHRVVHGGLNLADRHDAPISDEIYRCIHDATQFAPSHNTAALQMIDRTRERFPKARQIAIFDHALPPDAPVTARYLGGPFAWYSEQGIRRIGFHGISHRDCAERVSALLQRSDARVVTIHLGSGASLAAFRGQSMIDTTMGMTPLDGIMMGTRSGSIDPGVLLYLLRNQQYDVASLERVISKESGLAGCSGISLDTREIFPALDAGDTRAATAIDVYCDRICKAIGSFAAILDGLDALVWTGQVGEHMYRIRERVHRTLGFLGLSIDAQANAAAVNDHDVDISQGDAPSKTFVIRTLEEWAMIRRALRVAGT